MRPDWHCCRNCYFMVPDNNDYLWCHFYPETIGTIEDNFCNLWICEACGGTWDDEEEHGSCVGVEVELDF